MKCARVLLKCVVQLYYTLFHGVTVQGIEKLPAYGPCIIASNHITNHDPILLGAFLNPAIHFMAKEELFRRPILRWIVKRLQAFPAKRSGIGIGAIRRAIRLLNMGEVVGIFPEGTRNRDKRQLPFKPGVGFIAIRSNSVPIVPIAISVQSHRFLRQFHIIVGDPIVSLDSDYRLLSEQIRIAIDRLKNPVEMNSPNCIMV